MINLNRDELIRKKGDINITNVFTSCDVFINYDSLINLIVELCIVTNRIPNRGGVSNE